MLKWIYGEIKIYPKTEKKIHVNQASKMFYLIDWTVSARLLLINLPNHLDKAYF